MFLAPLLMVHTVRNLSVLREYVQILMTSIKESNFLTSKLITQKSKKKVINTTNFVKLFFAKFYHRHSEWIVNYKIGLRTLLQQGISGPVL